MAVKMLVRSPLDPRRVAFAREVLGVLWGSQTGRNVSISGVAHLTRDFAMFSLFARPPTTSYHRGEATLRTTNGDVIIRAQPLLFSSHR